MPVRYNMKIALVSPNTLRKNTGGVEQSVYYLAKLLKKKGMDVEVFCTAPNPIPRTEFNGIALREFPRFAPNDAYFFSPELYAGLKKENHDIIHAYGYNNMVSMLALLAKKQNQKFILTGASSVSSSWFRKMLHPLIGFFYHSFGNKIDKLVCVSEYEYELFKKNIDLEEKKYVRIPNGIDLPVLLGVKKKRVPHSILTVARLVRQKGVHRLINAMPLIMKKYPDAKLHVVGDGVERKNLEDRVKELKLEKNVLFHGHIQLEEQKKLLDLYAQADVFSLLADSESQGLVYPMAIATKCHVVATHSSAMKELIAQNVAVGVDDPNDVNEAAQKIMSCFKKPIPKVDIKKVVWSWERVGNEVLKVYEEVLQTKK